MPSSLTMLAALDRAEHRGDLLLCPQHVRRGAAHVDAPGHADHRDVDQRHPGGGPLGLVGRDRGEQRRSHLAYEQGMAGTSIEPPRLRLMITACRSVTPEMTAE